MSNELPPVAYAVESKRTSIVFWLILIGAILFFLLLACAGVAGSVVYSFSSWVNVASEKVHAAFDDMEEGRFGDSYQTKFSAAYRNVVTLQQHAEISDLCNRGLGKLQSLTTRTMNRQTLNGAACIVAIYHGKFEKGEATIKVTLVWEEGDWKFMGFRVESPVFTAMATCPDCGAVHALDAKFCPKCGKAISGVK